MNNQTEKELNNTNREGIKNLWRLYCLDLSVSSQQRVIDKVLNGKDLDQAIKEEGVILIRHNYVLKEVNKMFEDGELKLIPKVINRKAKSVALNEYPKGKQAEDLDTILENVGVDQAQGEDKTVISEVQDGKVTKTFIPRPKRQANEPNNGTPQ